MEKTTKKNDELIAGFLGWERYSNNSFKCPNIYPIENSTVYGWTTFTADQLEFSKRWDWLMPVVEKITEIFDKNFPPGEEFVKRILAHEEPFEKEYMEVVGLPIGTPIKEVYDAVVTFIRWHNSQALESK